MTNIKQPLVTGVIPVHNHENWVVESITSMVEQDYSNKRVVIIDDASTDKSLEKILDLLQNKQEVKIELNQNDEPKAVYTGQINGVLSIVATFFKSRGPSTARNYGIKTGWEKTDLFAFLDSDDIYEQRKISQSVEIWQKFPQLIGIVYSDYTTFNPQDAYQRQYKEPFSRTRLMQECIINNDSLYAKWVLEKVGLYDETLRCVEDYDLHLRATEISAAIHIPESLVRIRVGTHSSTDSVQKQTWEDCYRKVMAKLHKRLNG